MSTYEAHPVVMWEFTRACNLHCHNCTIGATESRGKNELTTFEAFKTIDQIANLAPRELIITGGDPLQRDDIHLIISYARQCGLDPALVLSPTSNLTPEAIARLERTGLSRIVFSIDGSALQTHEGRGVLGTFATTLRGVCQTESAGMEIEINTLVSRRNAGDLEALADLVRTIGVARWNLYFTVPLGSSSLAEMISADAEMISPREAERLFAVIDDIRARESFAVRVIEAPQYRRYRLQRTLDARLDRLTRDTEMDPDRFEPGDTGSMDDVMESALDGARGFLFISHSGDVRPSEFLLFSAGNLRFRPLDAIYRSSDLFIALRDPDNLKGKCGRCEFRWICGGSRARAWAMKGNIFAEDPLCNYEPGLALAVPAGALVQRGA